MLERLKNRWVPLIVVAVVIGVVVGAVGGQVVVPRGDIQQIASLGDRVMLTSPLETGAGGAAGDNSRIGVLSEASVSELPLTAPEAVAAGWQDPVLCDQGRGRTFRKAGEQDVPYLLIYDDEDALLGMYLFSRTEVSDAPWVKKNELVVAGKPILEEEHWAMLVYFSDPVRACGASSGSCGFATHCYRGAH